MSKTLVAYFSCSGVTAKAAQALAKAAQADLYEIKPQVPYTQADLNWHDKASRSTVEMSDPSSRPAIAGNMPDLGSYDMIFVGFPNWWHTAPTIIDTFLEGGDFSGKVMVPFATSGGGGIEEAEEKLHKLCPNSVWRKGRLLNGQLQEDMLASWLEQLKA